MKTILASLLAIFSSLLCAMEHLPDKPVERPSEKPLVEHPVELPRPEEHQPFQPQEFPGQELPPHVVIDIPSTIEHQQTGMSPQSSLSSNVSSWIDNLTNQWSRIQSSVSALGAQIRPALRTAYNVLNGKIPYLLAKLRFTKNLAATKGNIVNPVLQRQTEASFTEYYKQYGTDPLKSIISKQEYNDITRMMGDLKQRSENQPQLVQEQAQLEKDYKAIDSISTDDFNNYLELREKNGLTYSEHLKLNQFNLNEKMVALYKSLSSGDLGNIERAWANHNKEGDQYSGYLAYNVGTGIYNKMKFRVKDKLDSANKNFTENKNALQTISTALDKTFNSIIARANEEYQDFSRQTQELQTKLNDVWQGR